MFKKILICLIIMVLAETNTYAASKTAEQKEYVTALKYMDYRYTPQGFELAVRKGRLDVVELYLKSGMNPDTKYMGNPMTFVAIYTGKNEVLDMLLKYKASIYARNSSWDLLSYAIYNGNPEAIKTLIKYKADVNRKYRNLTPIEFAVKQNDVVSVEILLQAGAVVDKSIYRRSRSNNNPHIRALMQNAYETQS